VLAGLLASCGLPDACHQDSYRTQVGPLVQRWEAATTVAQHAALVALPAQITQLQAIEHETEQLVVEACLQPTHRILLRSMNERIEGYLLSLDQSPDAALRMHMIAADTAMTQFRERMNTPMR
jgi:hypothetical protein